MSEKKKQVIDFEMEYLDFHYQPKKHKGSYRKITKLIIKVKETDY